MRKSAVLLLVFGFVCLAVPATAQEVSPDPTDGAVECQVGELCSNPSTDIGETEQSGPINDPPGDVRTSLITMGFIAIFVGMYFFIALSGRSLPRLVRIPRRRN